MRVVCTQCGRTFLFSKVRSQCFVCLPHPKLPEPIVLVREYESGLTSSFLAKKYGVAEYHIQYYIRNFGTPRPCTNRSPSYYPNVTLDLEWLDGWLLSDGSLFIGKDSKNATAGFTVKYRAYADYIVSNWSRMGLTHGITLEKFQEDARCRGSMRCTCKTHNHPVLTLQYTRWYPQGKKCIPQDVRLSPTSLREWYYGDGTFYTSNGCPSLVMGAVQESEADMMRQRLMDLFQSTQISKYRQQRKKLASKYHPNGYSPNPCWVLYFKQALASRFFFYIGPCTLSCYTYKWPSSSVEES